MDLLADLLANGKTARLYRTLVYEQRVAVDVSAYQNSRELASFFLLVATAAPGRSLSDLLPVIDQELSDVIQRGPTTGEMERATAQVEAHFIYRLQTVGGFGGKSDQLNAYNVFRGDPAYFTEDVARYEKATRDSVQQAAANAIRFDRRIALGVVPRGQRGLGLPGSEPVSVS
jgi:zinc protease